MKSDEVPPCVWMKDGAEERRRAGLTCGAVWGGGTGPQEERCRSYGCRPAVLTAHDRPIAAVIRHQTKTRGSMVKLCSERVHPLQEMPRQEPI
ncbi:unnamed protein product [Merluccius merluccius]